MESKYEFGCPTFNTIARCPCHGIDSKTVKGET